MKYFKYICLLIISLSYSCQSNEDFETETLLTNTNVQTNFNASRAASLTTEELEIQLHWISFLTAKAIYDSSLAEQFFVNKLSSIPATSAPNVLKLSNLLDDSTLDNQFEEAFKNAFFYYFYPVSSCPNDDRVPRGGPKPPGTIGGCPENICLESYYQQYLSFILAENCFEIYLPNGYDANDNLINTTAHPLTNFGANEGYVIPEDCNNRLTISPFNLHLLNNIIVTRPYRNDESRCYYTEFDDIIDFTVFLDN